MENFKTKEIIQILVKNKSRIIVVSLIAALASVLISYMLKPKFKSFAVVYPVNLSPSSEESNTEQLLQYFNSEEVMYAVANKFDLFKHYDIDTTDRGYRAMFQLYFSGNVKVSPTLYESIEIEVRDTDPKLAQKIGQAMIDETNKLILDLKRQRLEEYAVNMKKAIAEQKEKLDTLKNSINDIQSKYNIVDVGYQSRYISKGMVEGKALSEETKVTKEGLMTKTSQMRVLNSKLDGQLSTSNYFRDALDKYIADYNSYISFTNVVSKPSLPDKKYFPVRWIIVSLSTLSAFALACLYFILTNQSVRKVD